MKYPSGKRLLGEVSFGELSTRGTVRRENLFGELSIGELSDRELSWNSKNGNGHDKKVMRETEIVVIIMIGTIIYTFPISLIGHSIFFILYYLLSQIKINRQ